MLYVVATPIGNLEDVTLRALRILGEVDVVLCEDTRMTKRLLERHGIDAAVESYHSHSNEGKEEKILSWLEEGKRLALVSDAGTPGISDPGVLLVHLVRERLPEVGIEVVPGAAAVTAALSIVGFPTQPFTFMGFPPHKKGRKTFFDTVATIDHTVVIYESTHRLLKALESIGEREGERKVAVVKELTKIHERVMIGVASELILRLENEPELQKGEFVLVVGPKGY